MSNSLAVIEQYKPGFDEISVPGLPPVPSDPRKWRDWRRYVLEHRVETMYQVEKSEEARAKEIERCNRSFLYMANVYGAIYEARGEADYDEYDEDFELSEEEAYQVTGRGGVIPYVMYPFQVEASKWLDLRMRKRGILGDGAIIKSRDMGLTNTVGFWAAHKWLFRPVFQCRVLSRKEDLVDVRGDPDTIFWKIDTFLMGLDPWIFYAGAPGFDWNKDRRDMRLMNPRTGNMIAGESTNANAGRGGRATVIIYDEAAFMEGFKSIWTAGRGASHHRILVTTVSKDKGPDVYNLVHGQEGYTAPPVLKIPWNAHPEHDDDWYESEKNRDDEAGFRAEVLMDWDASQGGTWVYPESHQIQVGDFPWVPDAGPLIVYMDDGGDDDFALVFAQHIRDTGRYRIFDGYKNSHQPVDFYGSILTHTAMGRFRYGPRERDLMHSLSTKPPPYYYGDAHGAHIEQVSNESVYSHLQQYHGITVNYYIGVDTGTRLTFKQRRLALSKIIDRMDFDHSAGASMVLQAIKQHHFKKPENEDEQLNEYREPVHSKWSHFVSACEFFAMQEPQFKLAIGARQGEVRYTGKTGRKNRSSR